MLLKSVFENEAENWNFVALLFKSVLIGESVLKPSESPYFLILFISALKNEKINRKKVIKIAEVVYVSG